MRLTVFSGAGMSADSGLKTFRDSGGLWEEHRVEDVATPEAWHRDPEMVHRFYNQRRRQLQLAKPNAAHKFLAELQEVGEVQIVTQNVDDLHERAGAHGVLHIHGELMRCRCEKHPEEVFQMTGTDLTTDDKAPCGNRLRPNVVWFGEAVTEYENAAQIVRHSDALLVIGTSLRVYPAAGLLMEIAPKKPIALLDPGPNPMTGMLEIHHIPKRATEGLADVRHWLMNIGWLK